MNHKQGGGFFMRICPELWNAKNAPTTKAKKTKKRGIFHPAYKLGQRKMIFWKIRFKIEAGPGPGRAGPKNQKKTKINQKRHKSQNGAFSFATLMLSLCLRTGPLACFAPGRAWPPPAGGQDRILSFSFSSSSFFFFSSSFFFPSSLFPLSFSWALLANVLLLPPLSWKRSPRKSWAGKSRPAQLWKSDLLVVLNAGPPVLRSVTV